ncbi:YgaP family membrane protein [Roseivirga echinicomitans]
MMTRVKHAVAGTFILASLLLSIYVNQNWLWFTAFVGANLLQSSITNWCLMDIILRKLGLRDSGKTCC